MDAPARGSGPLAGLRVVELAGIGPGPHACMILADLGADVVRVDRPQARPSVEGSDGADRVGTDLLARGRPSVALDLKHPAAVETVLRLVADADVLVEGMRPGTTERLGLGPATCLERNPRLVYGRMTGWGQEGPLAPTAGHDLNYIAITGALHASGQDPSRPAFASNLLGDFGGGSTYLVIGLLAAVLEARTSGRGQVVDAAIVDGTAHLNAMASSFRLGGTLRDERASNLLDGGVPYYDVYETSDGRFMSVGPLEPQFYAELVRLLELEDAPDRHDPDRATELRAAIATALSRRTQAEWTEVFEGTDACVAPVLPLGEAMDHPHLVARETFVEHEGMRQPAPAPRFSATPATLRRPPPPRPGADTREALTAWGVPDVDALLDSGAAHQA